MVDFYRDVADRLRAVPGVRGVAYSHLGLLTGGESRTRVEVDGFTPQREEDRHAHFDRISPGYFATLGIPMLLGRDLGPQDTAASQMVCVINEELRKRFFAGRNPIGLHLITAIGARRNTLEIVGVVKNVRSSSLRDEIPERFYTPVSQAFEGKVADSVVFEVRTVGEPKSMLPTIRKAILAVNPDAPVSLSSSMEEMIADQTLSESQIARLCSIFGGLALLLAATGLYGVLSYGVACRTNEIGIRMALGAGRDKIIQMVLRETSFLVAIGLVAGVITAAPSTRVIAARLYGLSHMDPLTITFALALLSAVAVIAGYIPAARAARVNPVQALRHE
jgi:predicted permease